MVRRFYKNTKVQLSYKYIREFLFYMCVLLSYKNFKNTKNIRVRNLIKICI